MCGRYQFTAEEAAEIREIIKEVERKQHIPIRSGEVYPTNIMPVLLSGADKPQPRAMIWGFPHFKGSGVIINARSETVTDKKMFRDSVITRRCLVPSTGFYEWQKHEDGTKTKLLFREPGSNVLYMAGFYNIFKGKEGQPEERFIILTTGANDSMAVPGELSLFPGEAKRIHDRMPVILNSEEQKSWLGDAADFENLLDREHVKLTHVVA